MHKPVGLNAASPVIRPSTIQRKRRFERIFGRDWKIALIFVLPLVVIMAGLILWPFINAILLSMTVRSFVTRKEEYVGLANYARLLHDSDFISAVSNTIVFTVASLCVKFVVGMAIALMLNSKLLFRSILTGSCCCPGSCRRSSQR